MSAIPNINHGALLFQIIQQAAKVWDVTTYDLIGKSRVANVVKARRLAMSLARCLTGRSFEDLAPFFNATHGTLTHARDVMMERLKQGGNDEAYHFHSLRNELGSAPPAPEAASWF